MSDEKVLMDRAILVEECSDDPAYLRVGIRNDEGDVAIDHMTRVEALQFANRLVRAASPDFAVAVRPSWVKEAEAEVAFQESLLALDGSAEPQA